VSVCFRLSAAVALVAKSSSRFPHASRKEVGVMFQATLCNTRCGAKPQPVSNKTMPMRPEA